MTLKLNLSLDLLHSLRNKISEHPHLIQMVRYQIVSKHKKAADTSAWDCICAIMDRVSDSAEYLCDNAPARNPEHKVDIFAFYNFLNISATMLECIDQLAQIFELDCSSIDNSSECFNQVGVDGNGNDKKYFEYLRSICSVHPADTDRHQRYQNNALEWCPYVGSYSHLDLMLNSNDNVQPADLVANIYTSDSEFSKRILIYFSQIFAYVDRRFSLIKDIVVAIDDYYLRQIESLKATPMSVSCAFDSYDDYLQSLLCEAESRCGKESGYSLKYVARALKVRFHDEAKQQFIETYKLALIAGVESYHEALQNMTYLDDSDEIMPEKYSSVVNPAHPTNEFHYQYEKLAYLDTASYSNDMSSPIDTNVNWDKLRNALAYYNEALKEGQISQDDTILLLRQLDAVMNFNDAEWARLQLRVLLPELKSLYLKEKDLFLSDIELQTLIQAVFYETSRNVREENNGNIG